MMDKLPIPTWVYLSLWGIAIVCFAFPMTHIFAQNTTVPTSQLLGQTMDIWLATIGSGISLALVLLKWLDSWLRSRKQSAVNDKAIDVVGKFLNSLQGTDEWIKENIVNHKDELKELFSILGSHATINEAMQDPRIQELLSKANNRAVEAKNEIDRYYGWASKVSGIDSNNSAVAKLAQLEQFLTPTGPIVDVARDSAPTVITRTVSDTASKPDSDAV